MAHQSGIDSATAWQTTRGPERLIRAGLGDAGQTRYDRADWTCDGKAHRALARLTCPDWARASGLWNGMAVVE